MTEDTVYLISGLIGFGVFLYCFIFVYLKGKTKKQKKAEKWKEQGCVVEGKLIDAKITYHGDSDCEGALRDSSFKANYEYEVNGKKYKVTLCFERDYPICIRVFYDPQNPSKCITANEITESERMGHGCLITIIATFLSIGVCANILSKLFGL